MIFHRGVIRQFHCKLLLPSEIAKAEAIVAIVEPAKLNGKRASLLLSDSDIVIRKAQERA